MPNDSWIVHNEWSLCIFFNHSADANHVCGSKVILKHSRNRKQPIGYAMREERDKKKSVWLESGLTVILNKSAHKEKDDGTWGFS